MNWDNVRKARNAILLQCDWTQLADVQASMTESERTAWSVFRQQLRDLTTTYENAEDVVFPQPPTTKF